MHDVVVPDEREGEAGLLRCRKVNGDDRERHRVQMSSPLSRWRLQEMIVRLINTGSRVRMSRSLRTAMRWSGSRRHVREFGRCVGVVLDLVDYGTQNGPEVNVRWEPSGLRYGYNPNDLELV